ncbi:hypothetical protein [Massilia aerilata]|uniref:DUF202 domain-containing protein n=1 Tax=Massilia aerilata TaxID=453817 RepID=A0ABW0RV47_9BURK
MSNPLVEQKHVEFHSQTLNAWYASALEHDRSILTLAAGATGWLITLLTTREMTSSGILSLYVAALLCFAGVIGVILVMFRKNQIYLEKVLRGQRGQDPVLGYLDRAVLVLFGSGVVLSALIGISVGLDSLEKGKNMAKQHGEREAMAHVLNNPNAVRKSMNRAGGLIDTALSPAPTPVLPAALTASQAADSPDPAEAQQRSGHTAGASGTREHP